MFQVFVVQNIILQCSVSEYRLITPSHSTVRIKKINSIINVALRHKNIFLFYYKLVHNLSVSIYSK